MKIGNLSKGDYIECHDAEDAANVAELSSRMAMIGISSMSVTDRRVYGLRYWGW